MVTVFLADGFEEIEAICPIDILRRGGVEVRTASITASKTVVGAHGIPFTADTTLSALSDEEELILLPGGMPGTLHLKECSELKDRILRHYQKGALLAAICAAPTLYGEMGLLKNETAVCYPGMESGLFCKKVSSESVAVSGPFITARGAGSAFLFGLRILALLKGKEAARSLADSMCYEGEEI